MGYERGLVVLPEAVTLIQTLFLPGVCVCERAPLSLSLFLSLNM